MINKINTTSVNGGIRQPKNQPQFKGIESGVIGLIQQCEKNPMINVTVLDLSTAIVPRTIVESETNPYAGFEAFRREASGLVINCLIPGYVVLGIAKALEKPFMGKGTKLGGSWANEDTIKLITKHWEKAKDVVLDENQKPITIYEGKNAAQKNRVYNTIKSILKEANGVDGDNLKSFKDENFHESVKTLTDKAFVTNYTSTDRKAISKAYKAIAEKTHATENIKFDRNAKEYFSQNLESVVKETPRVLRELAGGTVKDLGHFTTRAKALLNTKGLLGLGIILPLAVAAQPLNRWLTAKSSGKKGAPIYKDFGDTENKELSKTEKSALNRQKIISIASMVGVTWVSMMKRPGKAMLKSLIQFKGKFPSMDQARVISMAAFASRMAVSEDKNDLREATVRDIATFGSFYFIGDYIAKGIATAIQHAKPEVKLINVLKDKPKDGGVIKNFWHWAKHTAIKSSDELVGKKAKDLRTVCQIGNIVFSLIALGIIIPKLYRGKTGQEREKELKKMGMDQKTINKYYPPFEMNNAEAKKRNAYKSFSTAAKLR